MNPEGKALWAGVIEHPDDVGRRRVLADWLLERNDPRGTFIQVQCDLAELPAGPSERRTELERAEAALLQRYGQHWRSPIHPTLGTVIFRRGFVEEWQCTGDDFISRADRVMSKTPLRRLVLEYVTIGQLRHLITKMPRFLSLREFELHKQWYWPFTVLAGAPFERLEHLGVSGNHFNRDSLVPTLNAPWWPGLKSVNLMMKIELDELVTTKAPLSAIEALNARAPTDGNRWCSVFERMPRLRTLELDLNHNTARFAPPPSVSTLTLRGAQLTNELVEGLVSSNLQQCTIAECTHDDARLVDRLTERFKVPITVATPPRPGPLRRMLNFFRRR